MKTSVAYNTQRGREDLDPLDVHARYRGAKINVAGDKLRFLLTYERPAN